MKATRLLIAAALLTVTAASAREYRDSSRRNARRERGEIMLIIDGEEKDPEIYQFDSPEKVRAHLKERRLTREQVKELAQEQIVEMTPDGHQSAAEPAYIFTQKDNKFSFAVGGFINLRASYDFNGTVQNTDFVTTSIPVPGTYATKQQLIMDASTSRFFVAAVANSRALGEIDVYADIDFRGGVGYSTGEGSYGVTNRYTPRVRRAYVSFLGLTLGRDITTFCDLNAAPTTIDFQGPNAYSFNYATLIRYTHNFCDDHLTASIALEQPNVSATYDANFEPIPQRMPDVPMYLQYQFGRKLDSHLRVAGVLRDMYAYNATTDENTTLLGWGVQFSGRLNPVRWMGLCFSGTYGEGITPYIQDFTGLGLDFTPDPDNPTAIQTMPMYGWQAALNFNFTDRLTATGGYSTARIQKKNGYYADDEVRKTQYMFGNLFYSVTPRFTVACEYLHGTRKNMNCLSNFANRASLMAQFTF